MSSEQAVITRFLNTVRLNKYINCTPTNKQTLFLLQDNIKEILYGGAAGGGKSEALLIAALQYVHDPDYSALLLRRTYADLALPGAIMSRSTEWLYKTDAHWDDKNKTWTFPSGATLTFGYLDNPRDHYRYQGSEFQFIGFDEVTQFRESQYLYLYSRLRRPEGSEIPLRLRCASNPGDIGHDWVKTRFINPETRGDRVFIPAVLADNPHLDQTAYRQSLSNLDAITREQLLAGNWDVRPTGGLFQREQLQLVDDYPRDVQLCRYWDLAASEGRGDWTAGALVGVRGGSAWIIDVKRTQSKPAGVEALIAQTAKIDGLGVRIRIEQEPGSAGVNVVDHYARTVLVGYNFKGVRTTGSKTARATALSSLAANSNLYIVNSVFIGPLIDELVLFPTVGAHDDQVDACAGAFNTLVLTPESRVLIAGANRQW